MGLGERRVGQIHGGRGGGGVGWVGECLRIFYLLHIYSERYCRTSV